MTGVNYLKRLSIPVYFRWNSQMNPWIMLGFAIAFEIVATSLLKASSGFSHIGIGFASIISYCVCFVFLALTMKSIPVGVAYAIWSGVGIIAITIISWLAFKETLNTIQIGCMMLICIGAIGLNLTTSAHAKEGAPLEEGTG
jgi:small multidrug resistance pump